MMHMEKITDWSSLWRELVEVNLRTRKRDAGFERAGDVWRAKARKFDEEVKRRWAKPDSSRAFILSQLDADSTVLDIGAGTGAWSALLARRAKHVTAVEPSSAMAEVMRENLTADGITNVAIVQGAWPDVLVEPHDFSLCSHAMYGCPDLTAFVARMVACTRRMCFLILRAPTLDGVRAEAAQHIWGHPLDSPNFTIAYNILLQMGIYANVLMEDTGLWETRASASLQDALSDMQRHFGLKGNSEHDEYLMELLRRRLTWHASRGQYVWPPEIRSALVYWTSGGLAGCAQPVQAPQQAPQPTLPNQPPQTSKTLTVFAAASLTESFTEVGKQFEAENPGVKVMFNFARSQQLRAQLEQGAIADAKRGDTIKPALLINQSLSV
jgi:precorrin-6B methylase 2